MLNRSSFIPALFCAAMVASSCGGSPAPVAPTASTVTGITLTLNTPGIGSTVQAAGVVSLSNSNNVTVGSGYTSDATSVATVTASGAVTGVSMGDATISVDYQGFRASKRIRVLPSYSGIFAGSYTINTCTSTGGFSDTNFCGQAPAGTVGSIQFNNVQSSDLTALTGLFALGTVQGSGSGTISSTTGALAYSGSISSGTTTVLLQNFAITSPTIGHLTGSFQLLWSDTTISGTSTWTCTMPDTLRTSGSILPTSARAAMAAAAPADRFAVLRALLQR